MFGIAASDAGAQPRDSGQRNRSDVVRPGRRGGDGDARRERMAANLGRALFKGITLTDAQKEQARAINAKYKPQRESLRKEIRADSSTRPDSTELARVRQLNQQQQADLRAILTAEQQTVFDQNAADLRDRSKDGRKGKGRKRGR
jgi:Spy/CpxP family protein refolding chaperone